MIYEENEPPTDKVRNTADSDKGTNYGILHWTFCYDDACLIHYSSKMDAGRFPGNPRKKKRAELETIYEWADTRDLDL